MKYFNLEVVTGDLILIKTNRPTPPACPVLAQSVPIMEPVWQTIILSICAWLSLIHPGNYYLEISWPPAIWIRNRSKIEVLAILAGVAGTVILENLATGYIERMIGA